MQEKVQIAGSLCMLYMLYQLFRQIGNGCRTVIAYDKHRSGRHLLGAHARTYLIDIFFRRLAVEIALNGACQTNILRRIDDYYMVA